MGKTSLKTRCFTLKERKEPVTPRAAGRLAVGTGPRTRKRSCLPGTERRRAQQQACSEVGRGVGETRERRS